MHCVALRLNANLPVLWCHYCSLYTTFLSFSIMHCRFLQPSSPTAPCTVAFILPLLSFSVMHYSFDTTFMSDSNMRCDLYKPSCHAVSCTMACVQTFLSYEVICHGFQTNLPVHWCDALWFLYKIYRRLK